MKALVLQGRAIMAAMEADLLRELSHHELVRLPVLNWPQKVTGAVMTRNQRLLPPAADALLAQLV